MKTITIFHTLRLHVLAPTTYWILIPLHKLAKYNCMTIHELYLPDFIQYINTLLKYINTILF